MGIIAQAQPYLPQTVTHWAVAVAVSWIGYWTSVYFYRLFFHPLRKIPGPWYAAATYWYEFYQDVILGGNYVKDYPRIHAKYGPVVRVSPDRVHVSDPEFFHEVYSSGSRYLKDPAFFQTSGGISEALPAIVDPDYHKRRRKMVNNLFSPKAMEALSDIVLKVVQNALRKAREAHDNNTPLDIQRLYTGVTIDTIMQVLCDKQLNLIDSDEKEPAFLATLRTFSENFFVLKHFPFLNTIAQTLPASIVERIIPGEFEFRKKINGWITDRANEHKTGVTRAEDGRVTVIDLLLRPEDNSRPLSHASVVDETYSFCFAGTHTTSHTMSMGTYYLLSNPSKLAKLVEELKTVPKSDRGLLEYRKVNTLPYLTAVIKESLRMSSPVPGILPRVVPPEGATWAGHYLPPGTPISISIRTVSDDPNIFPNPDQFIPERWLGDDDLDHYLVVFGKGSRACIGLNVAWMESYLCFANFFSQFNMRLYDTDEKTTDWVDCGNAMIKKHVQVTIDSVSV